MSYIRPDGDNIQIDFTDNYSPPSQNYILFNFDPLSADTITLNLSTTSPVTEFFITELTSVEVTVKRLQEKCPASETSLSLDASAVPMSGYIVVCPVSVIAVAPTITSVDCRQIVSIPETEIMIIRDCPFDPLLRITIDPVIPNQGVFAPEVNLECQCTMIPRWNIPHTIEETFVNIDNSLSDTYLTTNTYEQESFYIILPESEVNDYGNDIFGAGVALSGNGLVLAGGAPLWEFSSLYASEGKIWVMKKTNDVWGTWYDREGAVISSDGGYHTIGYSIALSYDGSFLTYSARGKYWIQVKTPYWDRKFTETDLGFRAKSVALNGGGTLLVVGDWNNTLHFYSVGTVTITPSYSNISAPFAAATYFGTQITLNRSGNVLIVSSSMGLFTYDLIEENWVRRDCILLGDSDTCSALALDGKLLVLTGIKIYDWQETSWVKRGASLLDTSIYSTFNTGVGVSEDGRYIVAGYPEYDLPYNNTGSLGFWRDPNYVINPPRTVCTIEIDPPQIIGSAFAEIPPIELYLSWSVGSWSLPCSIVVQESPVVQTTSLSLLEDTKLPFFLKKEFLNQDQGFGKSVSLSGNNKVLAIADSLHITIYDFVAQEWIPRSGIISITNARVSLNHTGTTMVIGEPALNKVTTYSFTGIWYPIATLTGEESSGFGSSVSIKGTTLAVGVPGLSKVMIYSWGSAWELQETLSGTDRFGLSVSLAKEGTLLSVAAKVKDLYGTPGYVTTFVKEETWIQRGEPLVIDENSLLWEVNKYRESEGLSWLKHNTCLMNASINHSQDLGEHDLMGHYGSDGLYFSHRIINANYILDQPEPPGEYTRYYLGENVHSREVERAWATDIVNAWVNSPPHHANLIFPYWRELGFGLWSGEGTYLNLPTYNRHIATQSFGGRWDGTGIYAGGEVSIYPEICVSLNDEGSLLVVGVEGFEWDWTLQGQVKIFSSFGDTWIAHNNEIRGKETLDRIGSAVSLNGKGTFLAIGASYLNAGYIYSAIPRIYKVAGKIFQGEEGISAIVRIIKVSTGECIATGQSESDGSFEILNLSYSEEVDIVFHNPRTGTKMDTIECVRPTEYFEE